MAKRTNKPARAESAPVRGTVNPDGGCHPGPGAPADRKPAPELLAIDTPSGRWYVHEASRGRYKAGTGYYEDRGTHLIIDEFPLVFRTKCQFIPTGLFTEIPAGEPSERVTCADCRRTMGWEPLAPLVPDAEPEREPEPAEEDEPEEDEPEDDEDEDDEEEGDEE